MPEAYAVAAAEMVLARLNAFRDDLEGCRPARSYADWEVALKRTGEMRVDVTTGIEPEATDLATFGSLAYTIAVDIAVRKKFDDSVQDDDTGRVLVPEVDKLVCLVQQIHERIATDELNGMYAGEGPYPVWQSTKLLVCPHAKSLRELRQFCGVVRVYFRVDSDLLPVEQ